jgi:hypothetical protein
VSTGGLDVGRVYASVGARLDESGFDRFERRLDSARRDARDDVVAHARLDPSLAGAERYDREVSRLRTESHDDIVTHAHVDADTRGIDNYSRRVQEADRHNTDFVRGAGRMRGSLGVLTVGGAGFAAAGIAAGGLAIGVKTAVGAFEESEVVQRRQSLVIKTMGQDAGATAEHINRLATAQMKRTAVDDDSIVSAANVIRTFKDIRNEAGAGNDVFDRTTKATLDMAAAFGGDLQTNAVRLGRALNDPVRGASALSRTGAIAAADLDKLKKAAEDGAPKLELQRMVLNAVEKQVQGTAESSATGSQKMSTAFGELEETLGKKLAPTFNTVAGFVTHLINETAKGQGPIAALGHAIGDVVHFIGGLVSQAQKGRGPLDALADGASAVFHAVKDVITGLIAGGRAIVDFIQHNEDVQRILGQVKRNFGAFVDFLKGVFADAKRIFRDVLPDLKNIAEGVASMVRKVVDVIGPVVRAVLPGLSKAFRGVMEVVRAVVKVLAGIFSGDFSKIWDGLKGIVKGALDAVEGVIKGAFNGFKALGGKLFGAVGDGIKGAINGVIGIAEGLINKIIDVINIIPGVNIGHVGGGGSGRAAILPAGALTGRAAATAPAGGGDVNNGTTANDLQQIADVGNLDTNPIHNVEHSVAGIISKLPGNPFKAPFTGVGSYVLGKAADFIKSKASAIVSPDLSSLTPIIGSGHTYAVAQAIARKYGLSVSSGYRTPEHNAAVGGVPNSLHTHGSASNPGAIDLVGPYANMYAALRDPVVQALQEHLVHDVGSGLHLHLGFFKQGGIPNPSAGALDDHVLLDPHGRPVARMSGTEGILNTPQMREVNRALGVTKSLGIGRYGSLGDLWGSGMKHYAHGGKISYSATQKLQGKISDLETTYGLRERAFNQVDEQVLVEDDNGNVHIDKDAKRVRTRELTTLYGIRGSIGDAERKLRDMSERLVKRYRRMLAELDDRLGGKDGLRAQLAAVKGNGKKAQDMRTSLQNKIDRASGRRDTLDSRKKELAALAHQLGFDIQGTDLDLGDLRLEAKGDGIRLAGPGGGTFTSDKPSAFEPGPGILGGIGPAVTTADDTTTGAGGGPGTPDDTTSAVADAQAVAAQAQAQAAALQADLAAAQTNLAAFTGPGDIGAGGPNAFGAAGFYGDPALGGHRGAGYAPQISVTIQTLVPPTGRAALELAGAVVSAIGSQPAPQSNSGRVG